LCIDVDIIHGARCLQGLSDHPDRQTWSWDTMRGSVQWLWDSAEWILVVWTARWECWLSRSEQGLPLSESLI
jgi:hypothetical protein